MKRHLIFFNILVFAAMLYSCSKIEIKDYTNLLKKSSVIKFAASYPVIQTRANDAGFADGDKMGIFVVDYDNGQPGVLDYSGNRADNIRFTYDAASMVWKGTSDIYWKDDKTPVDIYGYYPFDATISNVQAYGFKVSPRQDAASTGTSMSGYESSDLLWAKSNNVAPTANVVTLTYGHIMAGVKVTLQRGEGFDAEQWKLLEKSVLVTNTVVESTVNISNGSVTPVEGGNKESIVPYSNNNEFRAVVVPQYVNASEELLCITVDGVSYSFLRSEGMTYSSGKIHAFTIRVDKKSMNGDYVFSLVDESIEEWIDDPEFHDGIVREYLVVDVAVAGGLEEAIKMTGYQIENISNLKIQGYVNHNDLKFIRNNMHKTIKALNMQNVKITGTPEEEDVLSFGNDLWERKDFELMTHFVFPKQVRKITDFIFSGSSLVGSLTIPEGVEEIGVEAFSFCPLSGTLTLPSTLKVLRGGAFAFTNLRGNLVLPDGLQIIGPKLYGGQNYDVFEKCKFDGNMYLPESLTSYDCLGLPYMTGDIIVPQGIKEIPEGVHANSRCISLSLPEGILSIGKESFRNSYLQGEVVIPSTCRYIGNSAFQDSRISAVIFPEELAYLGTYAFAGTRIAKAQIPERVITVAEGLFQECKFLSDVVLHENIVSIGPKAFAYSPNIKSFVSLAKEPPLLAEDAFDGVARDNFTIEVPAGSVNLYKSADGWKEFKRISAYGNFVCRPSTACALNNEHTKTLVLNADGKWTVTSVPQWCSVSPMAGNGKTELILTIKELPAGAGNRTDKVIFTLEEGGYQAECEISQYNYQYGEDECLNLQKATKGSGIDIIFLGDGWDAQAIADGSYLTLVKEQMEHFFGIEPYTTYRDYFNVYVAFALSQETGINTLNTYRDTRFNLIYGGGGCNNIKPHLSVERDDVVGYISKYTPIPESKLPQSQIILVPNSKDYGGCTYVYDDGSSIAICSPSDSPYPSDTRGIIQHEAGGHGFGKLGDEMILKNLFVDSKIKSDIIENHWRGWYKNISLSGKMGEVPWSHFIYDPEYSDDVDIFEGAMGYTRGVFRSEQNSCMNYGIPYYNAISRQEIMRRILDYSGEGFTMEKFYATDSKEWGKTASQTKSFPTGAYVENSWHTLPYNE